MEQIKLINLENVSEEEANKYDFRETARAVVLNRDNLVALVYAKNRNYFTVPGGGIDENENHEMAAKREVKEEIGYDIEIIKEIGFTTEYRKPSGLKQIAYCYLAKIVGEKGEPNLTQDEIEEGCETLWLSIEDAIKKIQETNNDIYWWPYVKIREVAFLEEVNQNLK